ncbi:MAG: multidrug effflux MFS transporter [Chloroflexales bacterium]|nr:multidrug effflux MFS transporter [Chloroflexales bacterium]
MIHPETESLPRGDTRTRRIGLVFIIGALSAFGPLSIDMYLPGLPALSQDLGGTAWQAQFTLSACLLGLAGGQIVVGPLSDRLGRRGPLLVGLLAYTIASVLCALSPSVTALIALRFVQGVAGSAGIVIARAVVRDLYSGAAAARFFALTMAINGLAPILAPVLGGLLLAVTTWRTIFLVLAGIGAILLAAATLGLAESLPAQRRQTGGLGATLATFRLLLGDRPFVGYALSSGLAFAAMFAYISGSPFVLQDMYHVSPQAFSFIFAANALGIVFASQISGRLVGRVPAWRLLAVGMAGALLGGLLLLAVVVSGVGLVGILPAFFLVVASIGFIAPNATALALAGHPRIAGSASGLIGVVQYLIGAVASPVVGIGGSGTALPVAIIIAVLNVGAFVVFVGLTRGGAGSAQT